MSEAVDPNSPRADVRRGLSPNRELGVTATRPGAASMEVVRQNYLKESAVLTITPAAAGAINDLVADREGAGLRIFPATEADPRGPFELRLALTSCPAPTDEVVTDHGSRVFVEHGLSPLLADKILDLTDREIDARYRFRLRR
jgi:Fe-S cluster assembly iron-binding protein IscA